MTTRTKTSKNAARSRRQWAVLSFLVISGAVLLLEVGDSIENFARWKRGGGEGSWDATIATCAVLLIGWGALVAWLDTRRRGGRMIALATGTLFLCAMMWIGQRS
jgi:hypothetical protein